MLRRFPHRKWLALAFAAAAVLLVPAIALARAGGGGNYGGGGGGGGGFGGGSGGGDGGLIYLLIWLVLNYPLIGVPLVIAVVAAMIFGGKEARSRQVSRTIRRGRQTQARHARDTAVERLRSRDPNFDEAGFLERTSNAFVKIQYAWSRQDLSPVRPFVSDGIDQRFQLYLDMQRADGYRNEMRDVTVDDARIVAVRSGKRFDTIHVRFTASAHDADVDLESGNRIRGSSSRESFVEFWSFHRKPGARTLERPGAIEGSCPSCGSPLEVVDKAKCLACGSVVNSGDHDWVLAEITQAEEWKVPDEALDVPGLRELQESDPSFSVQHVEDRVSVAFWKLRAAEFFSDPGHVAPVLSETMPEDERRELLAFTGDERCWKLPAVGTVELVDVQLGEANGFDRLRVMVRWSGTLVARSGPRQTRTLREQTIYTHVYSAVRRHGSKSAADRAFASASCTSCGAPIAVSEHAECRYCGANLVDGRHDWVLESVGPYTVDMVTRRTQRERRSDDHLNGHVDRELTYAVIAKIALQDGELHEKERKHLIDVGRKRGLSAQQMQAVLNAAAAEDVELPVPRDHREARDYLEQMVRASLVDGKVSGDEKRFLYEFAGRVGMSPADVRLIVNRERGASYRQAKRVLKSSRSSSQGA